MNYPLFNTTETVIITPILSAIIEKDYIKLKKVLELENKRPKCETIPSDTPLSFAQEDHNAAEILIKQGADANARYINMLPTDLIPSDIEKNDTLGLDVITPLFVAMKGYNEDLLVILLRAEARTDILSQIGRRKFMWLNYVYEKLFKLILPHDGGLNELNDSGSILMHKAVAHVMSSEIQPLLQHSVNTNFKDSNGNAPSILAVIMGNFIALNMLCNFGPDLEADNETGNTASNTIAESLRNVRSYTHTKEDRIERLKHMQKKYKIFKTLLCLGVNPNACHDNGWAVFKSALRARTNYYSYDNIFNIPNVDEDLIEWLLMYGLEWKARINFLDKVTRIRAKERIVEYHVKRQLAGLNFQTDVLIEGKNLLKEGFKEQCIAELEKMKTWHLFENMTMHKFLRCSSKRLLVSVSSRKEVEEIDNDGLYKIEFPIYKNLLEHNFKEGKMYELIYKRAYDDLDNLCNYHLPNIVLDKIIDFINIKDMDNVKKAKNI